MVKSGFPITMIRDIVSLPTMRTVLPSYYQVDGMIFAVASSPEIPMPEQWMPWLIQSSDGKLVDKDVDKLADGLMNGLRAHLDFMRQEKSPLPNELTMAEDTGDFSRPSTALESWLTGLLHVHKLLEPVWESAWQQFEKKHADTSSEAPEARLARCLKLFSTLANVDLALSYRNQEQAAQLKSNMPLLIRQLPSVLADYTKLSGELAGALPNQFETFTKTR